jgi:hypothetical protein
MISIISALAEFGYVQRNTDERMTMTQTQSRGPRRLLVLGVVAIALAGGAYSWSQRGAFAQMMQHGAGHGTGMGHMHGADGTGHDEVNMPGLKGEDATQAESADLAMMFRNFQTLSRKVEELPNGIRTVTTSSDEAVRDALIAHVSGMLYRVEAGRDPKIVIQSPTLDIFFERRDRLKTEYEITDEGIIVTQTSDDPELVAAMHKHAAEVSAMAERGMQAVHEMMMQRASN